MANKKKRGRPPKNKEPKERTWFVLEHEVLGSIIGVVLLAFVIIIVLAFFGASGFLSEKIVAASHFLFGRGAFLFPLILFMAALYILLSHKPKVVGTAILGSTLVLLSLLGLIGVFGTPESRLGGWIGYVVSLPFERSVGIWGAVVFLLAVLVSGVLVTFRIPLRSYARELIVSTGEDEEGNKVFGKKIVQEKGLIETVTGAAKKVKGAVPVKPKPAEETVSVNQSQNGEEKEKKGTAVAAGAGFNIIPVSKDYLFPPVDLLEKETGAPQAHDIKANAVVIQKTLENFGIPVEMAEVNVGPSVTQFTLKPAAGVRLSKIRALHSDLALSLAASPLRIEAPIPGKSLVGIEVPNEKSMTVRLRAMLEEFDESAARPLSIAAGRDVSGAPYWASLTKMPHLLVAGATGSGKSVAINSMLITFLYQHAPELLRFLMIDPKRVELTPYNGIPHLLTPVITEPKKALAALKWAVSEMERRYEVLAEKGARDIASYNQDKEVRQAREFMPYIVVVVDELADLMAVHGREVEGAIVRLAQMARAVGIHLVLSTQRPSVEVITGLIKANITTRMAFQVASQVDSRTIIDQSGAEKLMGNGDMLFQAADSPKPKRVQGTFVSDKEVKEVVAFLRDQADKTASPAREEGESQLANAMDGGGSEGPRSSIDLEKFSQGAEHEDELFTEAKELVISRGKASASMLQRRLRVGYARAARLLDMLEEAGVVGPPDGAKPRDVYVSKEDVGGEYSSTDEDDMDESEMV